MKISEAKVLGYSVKEPTPADIKGYCNSLVKEDYRYKCKECGEGLNYLQSLGRWAGLMECKNSHKWIFDALIKPGTKRIIVGLDIKPF
jgi:hypothetical protein